MARYKIADSVPRKKAYVNIVNDGPRLVKAGDTIEVADDVIPAVWMLPKDAKARAAVERRDKGGRGRSDELAEARKEIARLQAKLAAKGSKESKNADADEAAA